MQKNYSAILKAIEPYEGKRVWLKLIPSPTTVECTVRINSQFSGHADNGIYFDTVNDPTVFYKVLGDPIYCDLASFTDWNRYCPHFHPRYNCHILLARDDSDPIASGDCQGGKVIGSILDYDSN